MPCHYHSISRDVCCFAFFEYDVMVGYPVLPHPEESSVLLSGSIYIYFLYLSGFEFGSKVIFFNLLGTLLFFFSMQETSKP